MVSDRGYWSRIGEREVSRRRAFIASGATAIGAGILAACGRAGNNKGGKTNGSVLVAEPVDTSTQAKQGGVFKWYSRADIVSLEPHNTQAGARDVLSNVYSKLLNIKPGHLAPSTWNVEGEIAESWEWAPDGLTLTMKLRQNAGWAPIPPMHGRNVTVDDIAYTFKRWHDKGSNRADYFNDLNPEAPIISLATPDSRTLVWKLAFPIAGMLALFANEAKVPWVLPKEEGENKLDVRAAAYGSGPWYLAEYAPSVSILFKRSPGYWDKAHAYISEIQRPLINEYASQIAQFRAGNIYVFDDLRAEDLLPTKHDLPQLQMYTTPPGDTTSFIFFGWKPEPPEKTPFRDERVRQAYSMALDRDAYLDVFFNISGFEAQGLPVEKRWAGSFHTGFDGWWLDPRSKDFGPNTKYFLHDLPEAKKLLSAAGYPNGLEVTSNWPNTGYGDLFNRNVQVYEGMAREAGFKFNTVNPDYGSAWPQKVRDNRGNFEGIAYRNASISQPDAVERLLNQYGSYAGGIIFTGFDPDGRGAFAGDPGLETMIFNARKEFDTERRRAIVFDIQRYIAKKLYYIQWLGSASGFELIWPVMKNHKVYQGIGSPRYSVYEWIDETQPPLKKA